MALMRRFTVWACKLGLRLVFKVDSAEFRKIQGEGPLIAYTNHTSLVEAPMIYTHLKPREKVTGLAKVEFWDKPFMGWLFDLWEVMPIRRGEADMEAMRTSIDLLKRGYILGIAPEGTRSASGSLMRAQSGIAVLALHSGSPLQPIANWSIGKLSDNLKRLRRTPYHFRVGPAFRVDTHGQKVTREARQEIADAIMYQLAKVLPEELRGDYADLEKASGKWLAFTDPGPVPAF